MTAAGLLPAGTRLTASGLRAVAPLAAYKASSQSVSSSTILQNDSVLSVPVAANAIYFFECLLSYQGGTSNASDLKFAWGVPSGTSMVYQVTGQTVAATPAATLGYLRGVAGMSIGTAGAGNSFSCLMSGTVNLGASSGNLTLQWAQNTSNATATIVQTGSILSLWQVQ